MKKLILLMVIVPSFAWAAPHEFIYQAEEGNHTVIPSIDTNFGSTETTPTGGTATKQDTQTIDFGVEYQYGFMQNHSVGVDVGFSSLSTEQTGQSTSSSGLSDPTVVFRGRLPFEDTEATLRYGTDLAFGLENRKLDTNGNLENRSSGRTTLTPYLGFDWGMQQRKHVFGARLSSQFSGDTTTENSTGTTFSSSGGQSTTFDAFYENDQETWKILGIVSYQSTTDFVTNNVATTVPTFLTLTGRFPIYLNENSTIIPSVAFRTITDDNSTTSEITNNTFFVTGAYRFMF